MQFRDLARLSLLVAGAALSACTQAPNLACDFTPFLKAQASGPAMLGPLPGSLTPVPLNTVRAIDQGIINKVLVQSVQARRTETGTLQVLSRLVNCTDYPLQVQGRALFLDAALVDAEPPSAWNRVFLEPRSLGQYSEKSLGRESVANFTIELREGD